MSTRTPLGIAARTPFSKSVMPSRFPGPLRVALTWLAAASSTVSPRRSSRTAVSRSVNRMCRKRSPAHRVAKPRRLPSPRRALSASELDQINTVARTTGTDVILDALLLRLHTESACRRGGALVLRLADLDTEHCLIRLEEKGGTVRWQPISPPLAARLAEHAACRGATTPAMCCCATATGTRSPAAAMTNFGAAWATTCRGGGTGHHHPLAAPHHPDLCGTPLRLRHRPRLRRPHRQLRPRHHHLYRSRLEAGCST
jgi:hypothetical protein